MLHVKHSSLTNIAPPNPRNLVSYIMCTRYPISYHISCVPSTAPSTPSPIIYNVYLSVSIAGYNPCYHITAAIVAEYLTAQSTVVTSLECCEEGPTVVTFLKRVLLLVTRYR